MPCDPFVLQVRLGKHGGGYAGKVTQFTTKITIVYSRFRFTSIISEHILIFSGYLPQFVHRSTLVFRGLLHDGFVAKRCFQVSECLCVMSVYS